MSKGILGAIATIAGIALLAIPGIGTALGLGTLLTIGGTSIGVGAVIGLGLEVAGSLLLSPSVGKVPSLQTNLSRLDVTMDTTAPRKIVFGGTTAMANDLRYQVYTGSNQDTYWQVICVASHQVNAISEIWIDNEQAWTSGGGVLGRYSGYLTVTTRLVGTSANGVAIDSTWTSACTLTGCAYIVLSYKLSDISSSNKSPFASGVSQRITIRGQGALVYDPRLDSTVTGGSGTQRAGTQSTWAWDNNASCNPAIQLLFYLLGWQINGKLAVGMGIPPSRIDLASFITAANHCDESVTLNGGGTEPRYRTFGAVSEGDDRHTVIGTLCACMNATLRDAGGKLSLTVITGTDLASPVASFTEADILGNEDWQQTPDLHSMPNVVRGRRTDPSNVSLYQAVDYPEQSVTSLDGIDRIQTFDLLMVESNATAQRLAQLRLQRAQYQGRYSFSGSERWWQVNLGDVVQMSHAALGWTNKLFRVVSQSITRTGETKMILLEENSAIYVWSSNEAAGITPGGATVLDPNNTRLGRMGQLSTLNSVDPSTSQVLATGSIPPSVPGQSFSYTSTTTSVSISWPSMTLYRADGTTVSVSSGSQSITGLSASTTYKVYPYVADSGGTSGTVSFVTSGTAAGSGSPTACFAAAGDAGAAANMYARGNIPLNAFQVATPSSGSGSGGGGGSGCLHPAMPVGDLAAAELVAGSLVQTPGKAEPIAYLRRWPHSQWIVVYSRGGAEIARVTPEHRFIRANGKEVRASDLRLGDLLASAGEHVEVIGIELDTEVADLVSIELPEPHLYYAGPANLLCHNPKP